MDLNTRRRTGKQNWSRHHVFVRRGTTGVLMGKTHSSMIVVRLRTDSPGLVLDFDRRAPANGFPDCKYVYIKIESQLVVEISNAWSDLEEELLNEFPSLPQLQKIAAERDAVPASDRLCTEDADPEQGVNFL